MYIYPYKAHLHSTITSKSYGRKHMKKQCVLDPKHVHTTPTNCTIVSNGRNKQIDASQLYMYRYT